MNFVNMNAYLYYTNMFCSLSICIAAIIAWRRFRNIHRAFRPFIYCIWTATANEIIGYSLVPIIHNNLPTGNVYVLVESFLIIWQFKKWGLFARYKKIFPVLLIFLGLAWITENLVFSSINALSSYYRIIYSFIIVLLSISLLNRHIMRQKTMLLKEPVTLICLGFIIFFTYKVLMEAFYVYGAKADQNHTFAIKLYFIFSYINLFCNLIYALAVLWMPAKLRFSLPY